MLEFLTLVIIVLMVLMPVVTAIVGFLRWLYKVPPLPQNEEQQRQYSYSDGVPGSIADCMIRRGHDRYTSKVPDAVPTVTQPEPKKKEGRQ